MLDNSGSTQKRQNAREETHLDAKARVEDSWYQCQILDLSIGGAKLRISLQVAHGTPILLQVGSLGQLNAVAAWGQGGDLGVQFVHDPLEVAEVIMGLASYG